MTLPKPAAQEAAAFLDTKAQAPNVAVVLGSGLGAFGDILEDCITIPYEQIPHFSTPHVKGHAGSLKIGRLPNQETRIAAFCGRSHLYEGLGVQQIVSLRNS